MLTSDGAGDRGSSAGVAARDLAPSHRHYRRADPTAARETDAIRGDRDRARIWARASRCGRAVWTATGGWIACSVLVTRPASATYSGPDPPPGDGSEPSARRLGRTCELKPGACRVLSISRATDVRSLGVCSWLSAVELTAVALASLAGDQVAKGVGSWRPPPRAARRRRSARWSRR